MAEVIKTRYHYTYVTVNQLNNRVYVGVHSTNNLNDGYMGSGKALKNAFKKYGKDNFSTLRIRFHPTATDAYNAEKQIVTSRWTQDNTNYNLVEGGGLPPVLYGEEHQNYQREWSEESREKARQAKVGRTLSKETKEKISKAHMGRPKKGRQVINTLTNVVYRSVTEASECEGIAPRTLWRKLKNNNYHLKYTD